MIHVKTETYGIEKKIAKIQQSLDTRIGAFWNDIEVYGLTQPVERKDLGFFPRIFGFANQDYDGIFFNDDVNGTVGFIKTSETMFTTPIATLDVVFTLDGDKIYNSNTYRKYELAKTQAKEALQRTNKLILTGLIKEGTAEVFAGFRIDNKKFRDMQPWFVFSFEITTRYAIEYCTNYD